MTGKTLAAQLLHARTRLEANPKQMARHMRMELDRYEELESGARVLPIVDRKRVTRQIERLYSICGLK